MITVDNVAETINYKTADKGTRAGNYIIDTICIEVLITIIALILVYTLDYLPEDFAEYFAYRFFISTFYYVGFEYYYSKTPGKYFTNSFVINSSGKKPLVKELVLRNLLRIFPHDGFSFLYGRGMHDCLTNVRVVIKN